MKRFPVLCSLLLVMSLTGCFYPQDKRQHLDQLPAHVSQVQAEVDQYLKQEKVLPYQFKDQKRKFTTKYLVNFRAISQIPPTAYEKGGSFLYVIVDVEKDPTVRVFDLRINDKVSKVQMRVNEYLKEHGKLSGKMKGSYFPIDFQKLGMEPISIQSPYFPSQELSWLMDVNGKIYLDYRADVMRMIQSSKEKPKPQQDLRLWMSKQSLIVPAFSPPMEFSKQNEPVFMKSS